MTQETWTEPTGSCEYPPPFGTEIIGIAHCGWTLPTESCASDLA